MFQVLRKGAGEGDPPVSITVAPSYRKELGLRMRMGPIVAVRIGSPAEVAGVVAKTASAPGDRIVGVEVTGADGKVIRFATQEGVNKEGSSSGLPLDPIRLPFESYV